jgi:Zn-dependent alcohol dehydrogenase
MKIEAAVTRAKSAPMSLETIELESPRTDEILVKLVATGICHTDNDTRNEERRLDAVFREQRQDAPDADHAELTA